ncbi:MAG: hypothetical protein HRU50_12255 [Winogradskyella sp.]|uniref:DUF6646 family protein n=1 Tax=Winogradskyella sp. TaxID=1883156 RepID=UPI0025E2C5A4|nr:DUF6646 family protein [Winogradskyella sp.]NRB60697.1 hypothetical protein [Winogradskyella sp.]
MKNLFLLITLVSFSFASAQVFEGKGDKKLQIGANFQDEATGVNFTFDYGLGDNISVGVSTSYALGMDDILADAADFGDRFDLKARFNANLGSVLNIDDNFDFYPGISLSLKNFGGHLGARYFFSDGFGIYTEAAFPFAKYDDQVDLFYNQFTINVGASFNL